MSVGKSSKHTCVSKKLDSGQVGADAADCVESYLTSDEQAHID